MAKLMNSRNALAVGAMLTAIAVAAVWAAFFRGSSPDQSSRRDPLCCTSTRPADAVRKEVESLTAAPPHLVHEIDTLLYVESTVGEARELFGPAGPRTAPDVADDVPAWVFVAYGRFQDFCMGCAVHYSAIYTSLVHVMPKDGQPSFPLGGGNEQYDLTGPGDAHRGAVIVGAAIVQRVRQPRRWGQVLLNPIDPLFKALTPYRKG